MTDPGPSDEPLELSHQDSLEDAAYHLRSACYHYRQVLADTIQQHGYRQTAEMSTLSVATVQRWVKEIPIEPLLANVMGTAVEGLDY